MVLTTCQQLPVPGPGLPFPQTGRCSLRILCSACKRRVLLDAKTIFSVVFVSPVFKGVICNQILCPFLKITILTYCTTI